MIDGVQIWRAALDDPGWAGSGGLPASERERVAKFVRERDARRWVASRWALRRVLGGYLDCPPAAVELEFGGNGKPRLQGGSGPEFNLSHSQGIALVAVAERPLGVDVELVWPRHDLLRLAERALGGEDAATLDHRPAAFYAAWVRHEACLKCAGTGLGAGAPEMPIAVEEVDVALGYAAAVAVTGAEVGPLLCRSLRPS
ncbi:MAG: 4'-phosphopantetheinyl transferase family protein [Solirubrobacterales bacterium]